MSCLLDKLRINKPDIPDEFYGENLERFDRTKRVQEKKVPWNGQLC